MSLKEMDGSSFKQGAQISFTAAPLKKGWATPLVVEPLVADRTGKLVTPTEQATPVAGTSGS